MLDFFKALSDPTRLRLVAVLQYGAFTVQELVEILQVGQSRVSRHLKIMLQAAILDVQRQGTWAYYRLAPHTALDALSDHLEAQLELMPEVEADRLRLEVVLRQQDDRHAQRNEVHASASAALLQRAVPEADYREHLLQCLPPSQQAVAIGVGNGALLQQLAQRLPRLIAVDHAANMLESSQQRLARSRCPEVDLRLGDMVHLPLKDQEVDLVVMDMLLHHAASPVVVLAEIVRVLQPGGTLLLADLSEHQHEWMRTDSADQWLGFLWHDLQNWLQQVGLYEVHYRQIPSGSDVPDPFLLVAERPAH